VLRAQIARELAELGGTPEIEFEQAGGPLLALTSPPYEFAVQSSGRAKLGLREFRVTLRKDGQVQRTVALAARVRLAREVLVARRPLSVGTFVQAADVALAPHVLEREDELGLERAEQALGQQIARFLPAGQMLRRGDLKSVELVRRSRPVVILGAGRNVHVRLTGVALDSGTYGQMVRVRIGDPRQPRRELRAVVTGVGTVRLEEQAL
jgi:flagella basal body P-ring formation protein FlgA